MKRPISHIADIRFGYYSRTEESEGIPYLQVRQFDEYGMLNALPDEFVEPDQKSDQQLLKDGDVLFVGKGNRLFAWCYRESYGPYIASSIFFVLRTNQEIIYPEYLTAVLNTPQTKAVFQQIGSGTNIFSIRKSELGAFEIPVPSLEKQQKIATLSDLHQKEISLIQHLLDQKRYLYTAIISKLLH
jgi:restriction endonuclease S subunit